MRVMSEKAANPTRTMTLSTTLLLPLTEDCLLDLRATERQAMEIRPTLIMLGKVGMIHLKVCTGLVVNSQLFC